MIVDAKSKRGQTNGERRRPLIQQRALGALAEIAMRQRILVVEENTEQQLHASSRRVSQFVEPEAECLLVSLGGSVSRRNGMIYDEYTAPDFPTITADFPTGTRCVYVSPCGQEDQQVLFAIFSLPGDAGELHLIYDYRLGISSESLEPFFTLHLACEQERVWRNRDTRAEDGHI